MPYFGIFDQKCLTWLFLDKKFKNTIVVFLISTLRIVENKSLTHTVNFGIGSAFSEVPGPGPGLLYKVCHF